MRREGGARDGVRPSRVEGHALSWPRHCVLPDNVLGRERLPHRRRAVSRLAFGPFCPKAIAGRGQGSGRWAAQRWLLLAVDRIDHVAADIAEFPQGDVF